MNGTERESARKMFATAKIVHFHCVQLAFWLQTNRTSIAALLLPHHIHRILQTILQ